MTDLVQPQIRFTNVFLYRNVCTTLGKCIWMFNIRILFSIVWLLKIITFGRRDLFMRTKAKILQTS